MNNNENEEKDTTPRPKSWWKRKEVWGGAGLLVLNTAASPIFVTLSPWIPVVANFTLGLLTVTGLIQGVNANNLAPTKENYKIRD